MSKPKKRNIDYAGLADFRYEVRRFLHFAEQAARAAGIQPQQYQALLAIRGLPAYTRATVGALAERMQIRHHSAVELSARLERSGWIARSRGDADRREVLLRLTGRGQRLLDRLSQLHRRELRTTAPKLIEALHSVTDNERDLRRPQKNRSLGAPNRRKRPQPAKRGRVS